MIFTLTLDYIYITIFHTKLTLKLEFIYITIFPTELISTLEFIYITKFHTELTFICHSSILTTVHHCPTIHMMYINYVACCCCWALEGRIVTLMGINHIIWWAPIRHLIGDESCCDHLINYLM